MKTKLAMALLRRKELQGKVEMLRKLKENVIYETRVSRRQITENVDDITATVTRLTASQVTHEFDWHARQLREIDAAIQQANWTTDVEVTADNMGDYVEPEID